MPVADAPEIAEPRPMSTQTYRLLNLLLLGALFAGSLMVYPRLPERIPMHFDLSGQPDAWEGRSLAAWLLLPVIATGTALLLEAASRHSVSSPRLWNVPDKPRFLALTPEERAPIMHRLQNFMALVGVTVTVVVMVVQASVYRAAIDPMPRMPVYALAAIVLHIGVLVVAGLRLNRDIAALIRDAYGRHTAAS
jgi:uncharacterized membrane protein